MSEKRLELVRGLGTVGLGGDCGRHDGRDGYFPEAGGNGAGRPLAFPLFLRRGSWAQCFRFLARCPMRSWARRFRKLAGEYAYLRRGFGPVWGYLFGWMHSIVGRPASAASIAAGMMRFLSFFLPAVAAPIFTVHIAIPGLTAWIKPYDFVFTWAQPLAVFWLVLMTGVNYLGVRLGGGVQVFLTAIKLVSIGDCDWRGVCASVGRNACGGPGVAGGGECWIVQRISGGAGGGAVGVRRVGGFESGGFGGERSAAEFSAGAGGRSVVRGAGVCIVQRGLLQGAAVCSVANSPHVASDRGARVVGHGAATWVTLAMLISALGSMNSSILSGARVPYAMARDGIFFRIADGIHPKYRTPARALIFQGVLASVLALSGTFEELTNLFIFAGWIFYGLAVVALFPVAPDGAGNGAAVPLLGVSVGARGFVLGALALTLNLWLQRPGRSTIGLLVIVAGLPFYRWWTRKSGEASR